MGVLEVLRVLRGAPPEGSSRLASSELMGVVGGLFRLFFEDSPEGSQSLSGEFLEF